MQRTPFDAASIGNPIVATAIGILVVLGAIFLSFFAPEMGGPISTRNEPSGLEVVKEGVSEQASRASATGIQGGSGAIQPATEAAPGSLETIDIEVP